MQFDVDFVGSSTFFQTPPHRHTHLHRPDEDCLREDAGDDGGQSIPRRSLDGRGDVDGVPQSVAPSDEEGVQGLYNKIGILLHSLFLVNVVGHHEKKG